MNYWMPFRGLPFRFWFYLWPGFFVSSSACRHHAPASSEAMSVLTSRSHERQIFFLSCCSDFRIQSLSSPVHKVIGLIKFEYFGGCNSEPVTVRLRAKWHCYAESLWVFRWQVVEIRTESTFVTSTGESRMLIMEWIEAEGESLSFMTLKVVKWLTRIQIFHPGWKGSNFYLRTHGIPIGISKHDDGSFWLRQWQKIPYYWVPIVITLVIHISELGFAFTSPSHSCCCCKRDKDASESRRVYTPHKCNCSNHFYSSPCWFSSRLHSFTISAWSQFEWKSCRWRRLQWLPWTV